MENSESMYSMPEHEERNWALFSHLGLFIGAFVPFGVLLTPLVIWQLNKDKSEFVTDHAKEALNFKLSMLLVYIVCALLCIVLIGFPMLLAAFVVDIVFSIKGAIKASNNEYFEYPHSFKFIS